MKAHLIPFFLLCLLVISCSPDAALQQQLETLQSELNAKTKALNEAEDEINALKGGLSGSIIHTVYFKLKEGLSEEDKTELIQQINGLSAIEVIQEIEVGTFVDVGDDRALSDYGVVMHLEFASKADLAKYQSHEIHLRLKEALGKYLGGPPAVYDALAL